MPPTDSRSWRFRVLIGALAVLFASACGASESIGDTTVTQGTTISAFVELDIQGHRGARGLKPENTLPAFETALDLGVSTLEFDLHLAADGEVIVWHDAVLDPDKCGLGSTAPDGTPDPDDRTTPAEELMVRRLDSTQLATYRCDRNPDSGRFPDQSTETTDLAGIDYSIVTLEELFDFVAAYIESDEKSEAQRENASVVRFNMETKRKPNDPGNIGDGFDGVHAGPFELRILEVVAERGLEARVTIQSFDHRSLWAIHEQDPEISLSALTDGGSVDFVDIAERGASIWSSSHEDLTESKIGAAHVAGLEVIPWTVNELDVAERLIDLGADGLITDRPDLLLMQSSRSD
jgi:glycerophosphoryl diester phosphodiesterase